MHSPRNLPFYLALSLLGGGALALASRQGWLPRLDCLLPGAEGYSLLLAAAALCLPLRPGTVFWKPQLLLWALASLFLGALLLASRTSPLPVFLWGSAVLAATACLLEVASCLADP